MSEIPPCWCGGRDFAAGPSGNYTTPAGVKGSFAIRFCRVCGTGQTVPRPVAVDYSATPAELNDRIAQLELWRKFARESLAVVQRYRRAGRLLDVGCNIGVLVDEAHRAGFQATGLDLDRAAVAFGREKLGVDLTVGRLEEVPANSCAVVMLEQTLEHVADPVAMLRAVRRVLAPGGLAVVSVPHCRGLVPRAAGAAWYGWWPWEHGWHFTAPALRRIAALAGLSVAGLHYARLHHEPAWRTRRGAVVALADVLARLLPAWGDKLFIVVQKDGQ